VAKSDGCVSFVMPLSEGLRGSAKGKYYLNLMDVVAQFISWLLEQAKDYSIILVNYSIIAIANGFFLALSGSFNISWGK
jgi:hypothetical protein